VPTKAWRSRKTRDLLKVLVARRGRSVPRDELGDLLWPEADPDEIANRLSVAASLLRRVFSRAGQEGRGSPLLADPGALALERSAIEIDVESFLVEAERGLVEHSAKPDEARAHLEVAEALYAGPFLEEDPYQDWAIGLREEARATYIAVTRRLAEFAAARGDQDLASRYLLRILDQDRFDERAHLDLVAAMARAGRHGEARRVYRGYVERMTEIGVQAVSYPA
jgi:DNA-binding SARP family transcriptional activator